MVDVKHKKAIKPVQLHLAGLRVSHRDSRAFDRFIL